MTTFSHLLQASYIEYPEKTALTVLLAGKPDQPITYRQLLTGAAAWQRTFAREGIQPGEVVILILQHRLELMFAFWGTILHGAIPSIMPFLTEKLLPERYRADLAALVGITRPECIVTYREFEPEVHLALGESSSVRRVIVSDTVEPEGRGGFCRHGRAQARPAGYRPAAAFLRHHRAAEGCGPLAPGGAAINSGVILMHCS